MPVLVRTIQKVRPVNKVKTAMISEPKPIKPKRYAVAAGSNSPDGGDDKFNIYNNMSPELIEKINRAAGEVNRKLSYKIYENSAKKVGKRQ